MIFIKKIVLIFLLPLLLVIFGQISHFIALVLFVLLPIVISGNRCGNNMSTLLCKTVVLPEYISLVTVLEIFLIILSFYIIFMKFGLINIYKDVFLPNRYKTQ